MPLFRMFAVLCALLAAPLAVAKELPVPDGPVVLTISGDIARTNAPGAARFDMQMLQELDQTTITTDTIWTTGTHVFTGVRLDILLDHVGAASGNIRATAINDYAVDIPTTDGAPDGPILAYLIDGETMSRRDKGPLWVVYPYASSSKYRSEVIYSRSIWQLDRMAVSP